jgi:hypothetical protein
MTQDAQIHDSEVARAQWQVRSILQRLDSHRYVQVRDEEWHAREADFLMRLRDAHEQLEQARRHAASGPQFAS